MKINLVEAQNLLVKRGIPIATPTETVYGFSALISDSLGIEKIFLLKKRVYKNPLNILISGNCDINQYVSFLPPRADELMKLFWPGPLTLVLPAKEKQVIPLIRAGLPTIGIRITSHPITAQLVKEVGPIVSTSANLANEPPCISADEVLDQFGSSFPVLDGGLCSNPIASTILTFENDKWKILREGLLHKDQLAQFLA